MAGDPLLSAPVGVAEDVGSAPDLSIVIANRDTRLLLRACLASLAPAASRINVETIVIDNGSSDGSADMVAEEFPWARLIRNPSNLGFAEANNQGLRLARGRHVMLLNSDTEVREGALETLVSFMDANPDVGGCGPLLRHPNGEIQHSCFSFDSPLRHLCDMLALGRIFPGTRAENLNTRFGYDHNADVDWLIGAALVVRSSAMQGVGTLDERFRIHGNDSDWCYRIHRAGHRITFVADAEVLHHGGATLKIERQRTALDRELMENLFEYHKKHFGWPGYVWLRVWMVIGHGARAVLGSVGMLGGAAPEKTIRAKRLFMAGLLGPQ